MMDIYEEQLVRRQLTQKEQLTRYFLYGCLSVALVLLAVWGFFFNQFIVRLLFLVAIVLVICDYYYFHKVLYRLSTCIEYEYILTNWDLDFDKIVARSERSRLISVNLHSVECLTPVELATPAEQEDGNFRTLADVSIGPDTPGVYYLISDGDKTGRTRIAFSPSEKLLDAMRPMIASKIRRA